MSESFDATLREGTEQVVATLAAPSAARLRAHGDRRVRQRRTKGLALCAAAVLVVGGVGIGVYGLHGSGDGSTAAASTTGHPQTTASAAAFPPASSAATGAALGPVAVSLADVPAVYGAGTANKVTLAITNPGPARQVIVEFDTTGSAIFEWVESCDAGVGGGCTSESLASNPLQVTQGALGTTPPTMMRFSLALSHGSSTYSVWVNPPGNAKTYLVRVLDATALHELGEVRSPQVVTQFPSFATVSQDSTSVTRGGGYVDFSTTLSNPTTGSYVSLGLFGGLSCSSGGSPVSVPAGDYSFEWYTGANWARFVGDFGTGSMGYDLEAGASDTTRFRLRLDSSVSSQVASCQIIVTVSPFPTSKAPYYDTAKPHVQDVVDFTVH